MYQFSQFEEVRFTRKVIEPIHIRQVVAGPEFAPESPVPQWGVWQLLQLVPEIFIEQFNHPAVAGCRMILAEYFQHDHLGPPVAAVVALQSRFGGIIGRRAKIAVGLLAVKCPFYPGLGLFYQFPVIQDVGQRQQAIDPVRSPFPLVAIAPEPSISGPHHFGIQCVELSGRSLLLPDQHLPQPPFRMDRAQW